MRRKYFGLAIAAIATLGPMQAWGGDREIAEQIIQRLTKDRDSGSLADFTLDLKVDKGVVLFRGNVARQAQKELVLKAADGIEGIAQIIDEVEVQGAEGPSLAEAIKQEAVVTADHNLVPSTEELVPSTVENAFQETEVSENEVSLRQALAAQARAIIAETAVPIETVNVQDLNVQDLNVQDLTVQEVVPGEVRPTAATEPATPAVDQDQQVVAEVVTALRRAKNDGRLKGFGVDVKCRDGIISLQGRASSPGQRDQIIDITRSVAGVNEVRESISIPSPLPSLPQLPEPPVLRDPSPQALPAITNLAAAPQSRATMQQQAGRTASYRGGMQSVPARPVTHAPTMGAPMVGQPVPMAPYSGVAGAPRYDSPQLPNYAWPGYASHPNYAALTTPQQYSPSAWPYIGPFYPYPQVPLGWRKVSLEWDDGWWFLDFTDRH